MEIPKKDAQRTAAQKAWITRRANAAAKKTTTRKTSSGGRWAVKPRATPAMQPDMLRRIRDAIGLTQQQFAEELGVRVLTVSRWERGLTPISRGLALAIQAIQHQHEMA